MGTEIFEVGGCVRDRLLGLTVKDVDFTVVSPSFNEMKTHILNEGFKIHTENPAFFTIRAGIPEGHPLRATAKDADFVWARREGPSSDGRHPDWVEPGTLADDLERRDFTVNAMAVATEGALSGLLIDFHGGQADLNARTLRFVGNPKDRIREDGLRVIRGFRFMVTKGLRPHPNTWCALTSDLAVEMMRVPSIERVYEEVKRMFDFDTVSTLRLLYDVATVQDNMLPAIFRDGLRLTATLAR